MLSPIGGMRSAPSLSSSPLVSSSLSQHEGNLPKTVAQKKEFKALIDSWRDQSRPIEEMNYTEAIANAHRAFAPAAIPDNLQEIFASPFMTEPLQADSSTFQILLHCLKQFIERHGQGILCPLKGSIPDMTSTSEHYVNLQQVRLGFTLARLAPPVLTCLMVQRFISKNQQTTEDYSLRLCPIPSP
jgi:hypothetical protein